MTPSLLPYTPDRDAYGLLGVPPTASLEEINAACRALARTFHPDRNGSARATQEMQVVNDVRRVMTDPAERARYDWERRRFHQELIRPALAHLHARAFIDRRHGRLARASRSRYLRATLVGLRAALAGLAPSRCRACRTVIAPVDIYCAACGTPRLTGG
jgi:curved DNA-binding protein CbpA